MTITDRIEGAVTIAQVLLRMRGQWQGGATAHADMADATDDADKLLSLSHSEYSAVRSELKRRAGF